MLFPNSERVIYQKDNPLEEVICQFRFPSILRITEETPIKFQESIRDNYPHYNLNLGVRGQLPQELVQLIPSDALGALQQSEKAYEFKSKDRNWTVSLTSTFMALTSKNYIRWEEFFDNLQKPFNEVINFYHPPFLTRIGLRYQNVIVRSKYGLQDAKWSELLNPAFAGIISSEIEATVEDTTQVIVLNLGESVGKVRIRHGLVRNNTTNEICYLIDSDYFIDSERDVGDGLSIVSELKKRNTNLFRWCISERLHAAMEPNPL